MDSVTLDALDRRLLHALQVDGRAPFGRIAEVLDVSDRTIARRVERLRSTGSARVTAVTDSRRTGRAEWLVRLQVLPGNAAAIARALARRPDTSWVTVLSSGTEVSCIFHVANEGPAPLEALSRHPHILKAHAQRLLRHLMDNQWAVRTSALTTDQVKALTSADADDVASAALNDLDRRLLPALAVDGRATYPSLARTVGWSESAVRRRLDHLRRTRVLRFDVETDPVLFGFSVQCLLSLTVVPARLPAVAQALAGDQEAGFVGATTGPHNLLVIAVCRDTDALYGYLTERVGALDGVTCVETTMVTSYAKRAAPVL